MKRLVELAEGNFAFIEDDPSNRVEIAGVVGEVEIKDDKVWKELQKNKRNHAKVKKIIGDKIG